MKDIHQFFGIIKPLFLIAIIFSLFGCTNDSGENEEQLEESKEEIILAQRIRFSGNNQIPQNLRVVSAVGKYNAWENQVPFSDVGSGLEILIDSNNRILGIRQNYLSYQNKDISSTSTTLFLVTLHLQFLKMNSIQQRSTIEKILTNTNFIKSVNIIDQLVNIDLENEEYQKLVSKTIDDIFGVNINSKETNSKNNASPVTITHNFLNEVDIKNNTENHVGLGIYNSNFSITKGQFLIPPNERLTYFINDSNEFNRLRAMTGKRVSTSVFSDNEIEEINAFEADFLGFVYESLFTLVTLFLPEIECTGDAVELAVSNIDFALFLDEADNVEDAIRMAIDIALTNFVGAVNVTLNCIGNTTIPEFIAALETLSTFTDFINLADDVTARIANYALFDRMVNECLVYNGDNVINCNTVKVPKLTTKPITNINPFSVVSGGIITDNGGTNIIRKGVCWSTSTEPTIDDNTTDDGQSLQSFTSSITGLSPSTTYYVRSYAINSEGPGYGNLLSFTTPVEDNMLTELSLTEINIRNDDNGNDIVEPGEEIAFRIELENTGSQTATGVSAMISTNDNDIALFEDTNTFDDIPSGSSQENNRTYQLRVSQSASTKSVNFNLSIVSDQGIWNENFSIEIEN